MDKLGGHYAKWNKSEKDKYCMVQLRIWRTQQTSEHNRCVDHNKLLQRWEYQTLTCLLRNLYAGQEAS